MLNRGSNEQHKSSKWKSRNEDESELREWQRIVLELQRRGTRIRASRGIHRVLHLHRTLQYTISLFFME